MIAYIHNNQEFHPLNTKVTKLKTNLNSKIRIVTYKKSDVKYEYQKEQKNHYFKMALNKATFLEELIKHEK